jgi:hypothetical protein
MNPFSVTGLGTGGALKEYLEQLRIAGALRERGKGPFATHLKTFG